MIQHTGFFFINLYKIRVTVSFQDKKLLEKKNEQVVIASKFSSHFNHLNLAFDLTIHSLSCP